MLLRLAFLLTALALLADAPASAQVARLLPADEATEDPSFFSFRGRLLEAVARRDTAFLYAHTAPDAKVSFGVDSGRAGLRRLWELDDGSPGDSDLWPTLVRVLGGGGRHRSASFFAPYVYTDWPDSLDAFTHAAVVGESVRVRSRPSFDAAVLTQLSFAIVPVEYDTDENGWEGVRLADGRTGYVASEYLRSPIGYRAGFAKRDGTWMMTFFVAGD